MSRNRTSDVLALHLSDHRVYQDLARLGSELKLHRTERQNWTPIECSGGVFPLHRRSSNGGFNGRVQSLWTSNFAHVTVRIDEQITDNFAMKPLRSKVCGIGWLNLFDQHRGHVLVPYVVGRVRDRSG